MRLFSRVAAGERIVDSWYLKYGLSENPFSTTPDRFIDRLVGYDAILKEVFYRVEAGSIIFIKGEPGMGKTAVLYSILKWFPKENVIYLDCSKLKHEPNIEMIIRQRASLLRRLFNRMPSKAILLLDNVHNLSHRNNERIKNLFDMDVLKSVVFAGDGFTKASLSKSLKERISSVVLLEPLSSGEAVMMVRSRAPKLELLTDNAIAMIFEHCSHNPRASLKVCTSVCAYATSRGYPIIDEFFLERHLHMVGEEL